eukprot:4575575-Prymnesium_polylepis.1
MPVLRIQITLPWVGPDVHCTAVLQGSRVGAACCSPSPPGVACAHGVLRGRRESGERPRSVARAVRV